MTYLPNSDMPEKPAQRMGEDRLKAEIDKLPDWVTRIEGIDVESGVENCDSSQDYIDALKVFLYSIHMKAAEFERFAANENLEMLILRAHSLKSMARLVGISKLAELASELENACRRQNVDMVLDKTQELVKEYRRYEDQVGSV